MKIINLGLIVLITFSVACKTHKESPAQNVSKTSAPESSPAITKPEETTGLTQNSGALAQEPNLDLKENLYRLKVNFYSIGSGTENEMMLQLEDFVGTFSAEKKLNVDYEKSGWGKEGETDYCFRLKELDDSQQKEFIIKTKDLLKGAKWVHVYENEPCTHIKKP